MRWTRLALLALMIGVASCGMDGGSSGTGITTAEGNVAGIQRPTSPSAATGRTDLAGIAVAVEGTEAESTTDADGRFVVRGRFDGRGMLLFRRAADGLVARMDVNIPAGGTLTLADVQIDVGAERAVADSRHMVFDALIAAIDCGSQTLSLVSLRSGDGESPYSLHLESSVLRDRHGDAVACSDVHEGARLHVRCLVYDDLTFGGADVEVDG